MALSGTALADTSYVTIGTETDDWSWEIPYGSYYHYSTTQSIYTADEIGTGGTIRSIAYNVANASSFNTNSVQIYMGHTSKSSFSSSADEENVSNMTLVYSGSPTLATAPGWEELTLTSPFVYNGTDNLVIVVGRQSNTYNYFAQYFLSSTSSTQCLCRYGSSSSSLGNPSTTGSYSTSPYRANVCLGFEAKVVDSFSYLISSETTATVCGTTATGAVNIPASVTIDGKNYAVTAIFGSAFYGVNPYAGITIPSTVETIGKKAFTAGVIHLESTAPATLQSTSFVDPEVIYVPTSAVDAYKAAWPDYADRIFAEGTKKIEYEVTIAAANNLSELHRTIGEENLNNVVSLTVHGSINSYDFMIIRNKMSHLRNLDLSDCRIVANDYEHYTGFHTEDDKLPARAFSDMYCLKSLKLPIGITAIGEYAFYDCRELGSLEIPDGVENIGVYALNKCIGLVSVQLPETVQSLGSHLFDGCFALRSLQLPADMSSLPTYLCYGCSRLQTINIPSQVTIIPSYAFYRCNSLASIIIPDGVTTIDTYAFTICM